MAHFAEVIDGIVTRVLVIDPDKVASGKYCDQTKMVQTSVNTYAGVHLLGGTPLRRNFAVVGSTYNAETDEFLPAQPFPSWHLERDDGEADHWEAPVKYPFDAEGTDYDWNEEQQEWVKV
jgi:hypothetical protein